MRLTLISLRKSFGRDIIIEPLRDAKAIYGKGEGRRPQNPKKVTFRNPTRPIQLKEYVHGKNWKEKPENELEQMNALFHAWKANNYNDKYCQKEIKALQQKTQEISVQKKELKKLFYIEELKANKIGNYNPVALNKYLANFKDKY